MSRAIDYMGLPLRNPVIAASGPWSRNAQGIQAAIDAGAAAVVTETISLESSRELCPRVYEKNGDLLNTTLYSPVSFDQWEEEMSLIRKNGSFVIANIRGSTPSEFAYIASRLERWDADGLELTPFTPIGVHLDGVDAGPRRIVEIIEAVTGSVSIPVSIRLPFYLAERRDYIRAVEKAGAKGVGTTESLKALWGVNLARRSSVVPTFGGYTGEYLRPIMLAAVSSLAQITGLSISGIGGIRTAENALEAIMMGASVVQIGSGIMMNGYGLLSEIIRDIDLWLTQEGVGLYEEIRGCALGSLRAFEELRFTKRTASVRPEVSVDPGTAARLVRGCLAAAISYTGERGLEVNVERCNGCGLCSSIAPGKMAIQ